jgi:type VI secretion system protein VasD
MFEAVTHPTMFSVSLNAAERVNVDARKRSTPVVVRVYLLKNATAFEAADFFSLYEREQEVLGDALVWREEVVIQPGETRTLEMRKAGDGKVLAVLAAFRQVDRATWRASTQLVEHRTNLIALSLQEDSIAPVGMLAPKK